MFFIFLQRRERMGQATRTTKLPLDLSQHTQGGANTDKRAFYVNFFLAHAEKLSERVCYYSQKHLEMRERAISANELLTWAECHTVETKEHPWQGWNFSERFPDLPFVYRRSVIKDAIGKVRAYLSNRRAWEQTGKKQGKPGLPGVSNHPSLYQGTIELTVGEADQRQRFVRLKVYTGASWRWVNYPVRSSRYFERRHSEADWEQQSPKLVLRKETAELHYSETKEIAAKKQWLSGKPVKGEHSNQQLWQHVHRMNGDAAHKVARSITSVCAKYPGSVLLFERLRKVKARGESKSRRMNRRQANQLRGKITQHAKDKAFAQGVVTVEVNPHGTSQYCSRCGAKGERFSTFRGKRITAKWGKLFWCPVCHYEANADYNASANVHHSFYHEWHWQLHKKLPP
jgi:IS605 OrfB family transposase